jgi:hypothetical protein
LKIDLHLKEVIEEQNSHEQHLQQIIAFDYPWEIKEPQTIFDGEQILEPEIEEFLHV